MTSKRMEKAEAGVEADDVAAFGNVVGCRFERERQGRPLVVANAALPPLDHRYREGAEPHQEVQGACPSHPTGIGRN